MRAIAVATPLDSAPCAEQDAGVGRAAEVGEHQHDRDGQADVADAVGEERLVAGRRRDVAVVVVARSAGRTRDRRPPSRRRAPGSCWPGPAAASPR